MPAFVPGLLIEYPDLELEFAHGVSREIARGVIEFRHDLGIVVNPPLHPDLTIVDLYPDEVRMWKAVGVRRSHFGPRVPLIYSPGMHYVDDMVRVARERGVLTAIRHVHSTDLHVIARLTAAGSGVGVLPATIARSEAPDELIALRKTPVHRDRIALIWRHDAQQTRASRVIREAIVAAVGKQAPAKDD
jgi:DNA-binding transcriptional LysR family regulator